jgi:hypothetical protein
MGVNKVDLANGETLIDLQNDTVTPETLAKGKKAHNAQGEQIIGEMEQTVAKEEIEINVPTITQNGHYELTAPDGKVISKATVEIAVPTQGGGTGSGIIEVDELPTENIDENAIYKVAVTLQQGDIYLKVGTTIMTAAEYCNVMTGGAGKVTINFVDGIPNDMPTFSNTRMVFYVDKYSGIAYIKVGNKIQGSGAYMFGDPATDKGYTDDIYGETEDGIYTVRALVSEEWFIRENGNWVQITPEKQTKEIHIVKNGTSVISPDDGKVLSKVSVNVNVPCAGDLIACDYDFKNITEEYFVKSDGSAITELRKYALAGLNVNNIIIPETVKTLKDKVCFEGNVQSFTFRGTPDTISANAFENSGIRVLNMPWVEGEVYGAPWGCASAILNYNYTEG